MKNTIFFILKSTLLLTILVVGTNCIDEIPLVSAGSEFDALLVVEATLTDEFKVQEVRLSYSTSLETEGSIKAQNADVKIVDSKQNTYDLMEVSSGVYRSNSEFLAENGVSYQLQIVTSDGRAFQSEEVQITGTSELEDVFAERIVNDTGEDGLGIFVSSKESSGNAEYYRYTYEETYKIIAPFWTPLEFVVEINEFGGEEVIVQTRTQEERFCYNTVASNTIIQTRTIDAIGNTLNRFNVRYLSNNNPIISHRYSILVRQFIQSQEAFSYYEQLNEFASSESVFTNVQPGFIKGNIQSTSNSDDKVIGFFEVASVREQRIFFNYEDFYPEEPLPPYFISCREYSPMPDALVDGILFDIIEYTRDNENPMGQESQYIAVAKPCGDCTQLGSNIVPEFWVEE